MPACRLSVPGLSRALFLTPVSGPSVFGTSTTGSKSGAAYTTRTPTGVLVPPDALVQLSSATIARELLAEVLQLDDAGSIHARLEQFLSTHGMEKFIHSPGE